MKQNDKKWIGDLAVEVIKIVAQYAGEHAEEIMRSLSRGDGKDMKRGHREKQLTENG